MWLGLERNYRETLARIVERKELAQSESWLDTLPVGHMVKYGWVEDHPDPSGRVRETLAFFGVVSPKAWSDLWLQPAAAFRGSSAFEREPGAAAAWLRRGELIAREIKCQPYDSSRFRQALGTAGPQSRHCGWTSSTMGCRHGAN